MGEIGAEKYCQGCYTENMRLESENGSVLFMILIGVMLFAALSYTVASMMRGGNAESIDEEQAGLYADEILNYARTVRQVIQTLRISNGCSDTDISFENPVVAGYTNGTNTECQVFHADGGGLNYIAPPEDWLDTSLSGESFYGEWIFSSDYCMPGIGTGGYTCWNNNIDDEELGAFLPYVKQNICENINESLNAGTPPVNAGSDGYSYFTGIYDGDVSSKYLHDGVPQSFPLICINGGPQLGYHFQAVLIAR